MQLKLKENPREWQKFTGVILLALLLVTGLLFWKGKLGLPVSLFLAGCYLAIFSLSLMLPRAFRGVYRGGMRTSFWIGQWMGKVMLCLFYLFLLTPMGWLLRLCGKDLLQLRPQKKNSYWQPIPEERRTLHHLDKEF